MDGRSEEQLEQGPRAPQDSCARKVRGGASAELRTVRASRFQALSSWSVPMQSGQVLRLACVCSRGHGISKPLKEKWG